jgi:hypothetical protein
MVAGVVWPWSFLSHQRLSLTHGCKCGGALVCPLSTLPRSLLFIIDTLLQVWWGPGPPFLGHHCRPLCQVRKTALQIQVKKVRSSKKYIWPLTVKTKVAASTKKFSLNISCKTKSLFDTFYAYIFVVDILNKTDEFFK